MTLGCSKQTSWFSTNAKPANVKRIGNYHWLASKIGSIMQEIKSNDLLMRQPAGQARTRFVPQYAVPRVYQSRNNFEINRNLKLKEMHIKDRQARKFQSRPVPNFKKLHDRLYEKARLRILKSSESATLPETPLTLVKSMESQKKRDQQVLRRELSDISGHHPKLNPSNKWRRKPFIPKITSSIVKTKPFHLRSQERGLQRQEYDERMKLENAWRWQKAAHNWCRSWRAEYQAMRSQTNFKATPYRRPRTRPPSRAY